MNRNNYIFEHAKVEFINKLIHKNIKRLSRENVINFLTIFNSKKIGLPSPDLFNKLNHPSEFFYTPKNS